LLNEDLEFLKQLKFQLETFAPEDLGYDFNNKTGTDQQQVRRIKMAVSWAIKFKGLIEDPTSFHFDTWWNKSTDSKLLGDPKAWLEKALASKCMTTEQEHLVRTHVKPQVTVDKVRSQGPSR